GRATDILLESDVAAFGGPGMALELELLLRSGRPQDVRDWTGPEQQARLGLNYHWFRAQALAATGDYALAKQELGHLAARASYSDLDSPAERMAETVAQMILDGCVGAHSVPVGLWRGYRQIDAQSRTVMIAREMQLQADAATLQGLISLE